MKPRKITLCGSNKFKDNFELWNERFSLAGDIVYSSCFEYSNPKNTNEMDKLRFIVMDLLKIESSDEIFVIDTKANKETEYNFNMEDPEIRKEFSSYLDESTMLEIEYARAKGKEIKYLSGYLFGVEDFPFTYQEIENVSDIVSNLCIVFNSKVFEGIDP